MPKSLFILPVHSFVDLITNSSSELFICETKQKLTTFKKTLVKLAELHNEAHKLRDTSTEYGYSDLDVTGLFSSHFRNPRIQPYTFRLDLYPKCAEYRSICDWMNDDKHPICVAATQKMNEWRHKNPAPPYTSDRDKPEYKVYDAHQKAENAYRTKVFAKWEALKNKTETEMFTWAFAQNGLDWNSGEPSDCNWQRWRRTFKDKKIEQFVEDIRQATSYRYGFNAGDIMLETASDNTVPYGFFDDIQRIFRCKRVHLG